MLSNAPRRPGGGVTLFHLVHRPEPTAYDFRALLARGRIPRHADAAALWIAAGVSCFETGEQARITAMRFHRLGRFVAEVYLPDDGCAIAVQRTGDADGHHTVWASPEYFLEHIVSVRPV